MTASLSPDLALARRIEAHEAWSASSHAFTQSLRGDATLVGALPVGEGHAVFCGSRSPNNALYGWGLSASDFETEIDAAEAFYRARHAVCAVRLCPMAQPDALRTLTTRGYGIRDFMNVYVRRPEPTADDHAEHGDITIRSAAPIEAREWFARAGYAGPWADPDGVEFMLIRSCFKPGSQLFLARQGDEVVGGGALEIMNGTAALMAAMTSPYSRGRGVHSLLVQARLRAAYEAGCDLALVHTRSGADSQRNVLRAGFQLAYTTVTVVAGGRS